LAGSLGDRLPVEHQRLLERALSQTHEHAIVLLDPRGTVLAWLGAGPRVFGYSANEIEGEDFALLFTEEDVAKGVHEHELAVAASVGRQADDRWMRRKDGTQFWAMGSVTRICEEDRVQGYLKVLENRTDLRIQLDELERRGAGRPPDESLAALAHELRNALGPITNAVQLLQRAGTSAETQRTTLDILGRQTQALARLVNDLVDGVRIATGKMEVVAERIDLVAVVRSSMETMSPQAKGKGLELESIQIPGPIHVRADPVRLGQVLHNLVGNAIKYTPSGGRIWVLLTTEGREAVLRVRDRDRAGDAALGLRALHAGEPRVGRRPRARPGRRARSRERARGQHPGAKRGPRPRRRVHRPPAARRSGLGAPSASANERRVSAPGDPRIGAGGPCRTRTCDRAIMSRLL
jgi:PAS domain S-box-containing protein